MAEEVADKQLNIRVSAETKAYWERAAEAKGETLSEFIRSAAQAAAVDALECPHPPEMQQIYPWSHRCLRCGVRFK